MSDDAIPIPFTSDPSAVLAALERIYQAAKRIGVGFDESGEQAAAFAAAVHDRMETAGDALSGMGTRYATIVGPLRDVAGTVEQVTDRVLSLADEQQRLDRATERTGLNFTQASRAGGAFVDTLATMRAAMSFSQAGMRLTQEQLDALIRRASEFSQATGTDMRGAVDQLTQALINGDAGGLRRFGSGLAAVGGESHSTQERLDALVASVRGLGPASEDSSLRFQQSMERARSAARNASAGLVEEFQRAYGAVDDALGGARRSVADTDTAARGAGSGVGVLVGAVARLAQEVIATTPGIRDANSGLVALSTSTAGTASGLASAASNAAALRRELADLPSLSETVSQNLAQIGQIGQLLSMARSGEVERRLLDDPDYQNVLAREGEERMKTTQQKRREAAQRGAAAAAARRAQVAALTEAMAREHTIGIYMRGALNDAQAEDLLGMIARGPERGGALTPRARTDAEETALAQRRREIDRTATESRLAGLQQELDLRSQLAEFQGRDTSQERIAALRDLQREQAEYVQTLEREVRAARELAQTSLGGENEAQRREELAAAEARLRGARSTQAQTSLALARETPEGRRGQRIARDQQTTRDMREELDYRRTADAAAARVEQGRLAREINVQNQRLEMQRGFLERWRDLHSQEVDIAGSAMDVLDAGFKSFGDSMSEHLQAIIAGRETVGAALQGILADTMTALGREAMGKGAFFAAEALGKAAMYDVPGALQAAAASAAYFAAGATLTAIGAVAQPSPPASAGAATPAALPRGRSANDNDRGPSIVNNYYAPTFGGRMGTESEVGERVNRYTSRARARSRALSDLVAA